jgi:hypothetical protein
MSAAAILLPLLGGVLLRLVAGPLTTRLPPQHATWLISIGAGVVALATLVVVALVASTLVAQLPEVGRVGHWSASALREHAVTEPGIAILAVAASSAAVASTLWSSVRNATALRAAYRASASVAGAGGDVAILDAGPARAAAVPGRPGRVFVSRSLLTALSAPERRVVLAHERAHLLHHHHWHRVAVNVAAGANPLLRPLRGAIVHATERWADEVAVAAAGDRRGVAATIAHAAGVSARSSRLSFPGLADGSVRGRVAALLAPPPEPRPLLSAAVVAGLLLVAVATTVLTKQTEHVFELAGHVYRTTGH